MIERKIYFLIVNYNSSELVTRLVRSIDRHSQNNYQIVIVNNSPEDRDILELNNDSTKIIFVAKNLGFGCACNLGLNWIYSKSSRSIVWLINPDAYFDSSRVNSQISAIDRAISFFQKHPQISILGTAIYNSLGQIDSMGGTFIPNSAAIKIINSLPKNLSQEYEPTDWVSGCSLLINLANFTEVPQFDSRYFLYYEDLDFCLRCARQGHQIAVTHLLKVIHDTSSITNRNILQKYRHITQSYLIHIEKYGSTKVFVLTNIRMLLNTIRLLIFKPPQGLGKLIGIYEYWQNRINRYIAIYHLHK